jgi:hypothetical protein
MQVQPSNGPPFEGGKEMTLIKETEINFSECCRKPTTLQYITPIYSKPKNSVSKDGETIFGKAWTLYEARPNIPGLPAILIIDKNGFINSGRNTYPLQQCEPQDLFSSSDEWDSLPPNVIVKIKKLLGNYSTTPKHFDWPMLLKVLYKPTLRLTNPEVLNKIDWIKFVEREVLAYQAEKDPKLQLVFKATLLRGIEMQFCPHGFLSTGSGTGKSYAYEKAGIRRDKVTAISLVGTISQNSITEGLVQHQTLPICIEQLESQSAQQILGYMLTFMEMGTARISTAYGNNVIEGQCTFVVTSNPTGYVLNKIDTFRSLINTLGSNYIALGRRIGLLIYGGEGAYQKVKSLGILDEVEWNYRFEFFRAVEEYVFSLIQKLFKEGRVRTWLETPIQNYEVNVNTLSMQIDDKLIREFLSVHGSGSYKHIRGGALNCAVIDSLPEFVKLRQANLEEIPSSLVDQLLQKADDYTDKLVNINLESIANISKTLESDEQLQTMLFELFPKYLKAIVLAVKKYKESNSSVGKEISLSSLENFYDHDQYSYWSNVECNLAKSNIDLHNSNLDKYFGFKIVQKADKLWSITFTDANKSIIVDQ